MPQLHIDVRERMLPGLRPKDGDAAHHGKLRDLPLSKAEYAVVGNQEASVVLCGISSRVTSEKTGF